MCLCLTHLRNRQGPWVQANLKTEQASRQRGEKRSRGRSYTEGVKDGGGGLAGAAKMKEVAVRWVKNFKERQQEGRKENVGVKTAGWRRGRRKGTKSPVFPQLCFFPSTEGLAQKKRYKATGT